MDFEVDFEDGMAIVSYKYEHEMGKAGLQVEIDVLELLKKAAANTKTTLDDKVVAAAELALG